MLWRVIDSYWFGQGLVFAMCAGIVLVAAVITPGTEALAVGGAEIPILCGFRNAFGVPCPGCGLTRSFVFFAHGHPIDAFHMNWFGPPLFLLTLSQIPYRAYTLWRGPLKRRRRRREPAIP